MRLACLNRLAAWGVVSGALACGGNGGGTTHPTTPPTAATVSVEDNHFTPQNSVVQTGGSVTWNWTGVAVHNLTFTFGPTPLPANRADGGNGTTAQRTITAVGTYNYTCTNHAGMNGTVTVVH